jgi:7-cyano-7-deazaguanine synthase
VVRSHRQAIVLFSGGLDSTACVHLLRKNGFNVTGLFIDFGQIAVEPEKRAVKALKQRLAIQVESIRMAGFGDLSSGELPGRNLLLISAALFHNRGRQCVIGTGIHAGTNYYDCSQQFLASVNLLACAHSDGCISVVAPFAKWSKHDIYRYAVAEALPIDDTYSCEQGAVPSCGHCASCRDREGLQC